MMTPWKLLNIDPALGVLFHLSGLAPNMKGVTAEQVVVPEITPLSEAHKFCQDVEKEPLMAYFRETVNPDPRAIHSLAMFWYAYPESLPDGLRPWCHTNLWYGNVLHVDAFGRIDHLSTSLVKGLNGVRRALPAIKEKLSESGIWVFDWHEDEEFD